MNMHLPNPNIWALIIAFTLLLVFMQIVNWIIPTP